MLNGWSGNRLQYPPYREMKSSEFVSEIERAEAATEAIAPIAVARFEVKECL